MGQGNSKQKISAQDRSPTLILYTAQLADCAVGLFLT